MAQIKPFRALRYTDKAGSTATLTCPPYDIISEEQRKKFLNENPYNVIRLELPKGSSPYEQAGRDLGDWLNAGILKQDTDGGLYIYEEEFTAYGQKKKVKGFICLVKLEEFSKGIILPHEETLSKAKEDRFNLMKATSCNFSQIYSLYMDEENKTMDRINALSSGRPRYEFSDGEVTHRMWLVNDKLAVKAISDDFTDRKLYIADGHHRYETALNYRSWRRENGTADGSEDYVMMMLVNMENDGLVVFPTHRLINGIENFDGEKLLQSCEAYFDVIPRENISEIPANLDALYRQGKKAFAYYAGEDKWHLIILKDENIMEEILPGRSEAYRGLDVSVLHSLILEKLLGIDRENMANQKNLAYTRSFEEAINAVKGGSAQCAFILNPTRVTEIRDVAAAGEKMPQKSTYFYPKLITGLTMNLIKKC